MKRIYALFAMLISLSFSLEITANLNQVVSKSRGSASVDGKGVATFILTSPETQMCDLSFLVMPGEYADSTYTSVTLNVNGVTLPNTITFNTYGWQSASTTGNSVTLNKGDNTVQFISGRDDVPIVREIRIFDTKSQYASQQIKNISNNISSQPKTRAMDITDYYEPRPMYRNGMNTAIYYNTFILPIEYERDDRAVFYVPNNNATVDFNMYFFYEDPNLYSESATCFNDRSLFFEYTIERSGTYYLILEAKNEGECGGVTIVVNNNITYRNSFVSNTSFIVMKEDETTQVTNPYLPYNIFTTNLRSSDEYHDADSYLYLKQVTPEKEIVVAYSDNNSVPSDFDWGNNARIRTYLRGDRYKVGLCSTYPSYFTPDTCDIYHSFWNSVDTTSYLSEDSTRYFSNRFPRLMYEDAIESDIGGNYNCFAWTGWLTTNWINPVGANIEEKLIWLDKFYNNEELVSYGRVVRPSNFPKYTRLGANVINSVIDIWADTTTSKLIINHASIKIPFKGIPQGYDWESKDGSQGPRFFHPRRALEGPIFGSIIAHYTLAPDQDTIQFSYERNFYEAIASGEIVIEDIKLTDSEKYHLSQSPISTYGITKFEQYYSQWKSYVKSKFNYSDFELYKDTITYPQLLNYIITNPGEEYKVYKKFDDGDYFCAVLIKDISSVEGTRANEVWNNIMNAPIEEKVIRTSWGNVRLFIKTMLQDKRIDSYPQTGKIRSNEDDVNVTVIDKGVTISIGLEKVSKYCIKAINLQTSQQLILLPESIHQSGEEIYQYPLSPGAYIIVSEINGNINAKKIIVK